MRTIIQIMTPEYYSNYKHPQIMNDTSASPLPIVDDLFVRPLRTVVNLPAFHYLPVGLELLAVLRPHEVAIGCFDDMVTCRRALKVESRIGVEFGQSRTTTRQRLVRIDVIGVTVVAGKVVVLMLIEIALWCNLTKVTHVINIWSRVKPHHNPFVPCH